MTQSSSEQAAGENERQVHLEAHVAGGGSAFQTGRDLHVHFGDGYRGATRVFGNNVTEICPYPGLASFGESQAQWFFGRKRSVAMVCQRLDSKLTEAGLLMVIGPSGTGKSSLLRAGVVPALERGELPVTGSRSWPRVLLTPTANPVEKLAQRVAVELSTMTGGITADMAKTWAANPEHFVNDLRGILVNDKDGRELRGRVVVLVDQFEELFTHCADEQQRRDFIGLLEGIAARPEDDEDPTGLVLIAVRADFYDACTRYAPLRAALRAGPVLLDPMSADELREVILYPAQSAGLTVEAGLVEVLLRDAGAADGSAGASNEPVMEPGRLPLLAHALRATWQQRDGHVLTLEGYRATGGIQHAIAVTAEQVFTSLGETEKLATRPLFLRLVTVGDGTDDARRRVSRRDLVRDIPGSEAAAAVMDSFTQARLLTQVRDGVTITHEALLHAWPRLTAWIEDDRAAHLIRQRLEDAAAAWNRDRRDGSALYRGGSLAKADAWARDHSPDLSATARDFLAASHKQRRLESGLGHSAIAALIALVVAAAATAGAAWQQHISARQQRSLNIYNQTMAKALQLSASNPTRAAQLNLAAYRMRPTPEAATRLLSTENTPLSVPLSQTNDLAISLSPDGRTLAMGGRSVWLWDVTNPVRPSRFRQPLPGRRGGVSALAFSSNNRMLAIGDSGTSVSLWDVTDPAHPRKLGQPLHVGNYGAGSLAFSPDGRLLAIDTAGLSVQLWEVADPAHPYELAQPEKSSGAGSVAFSPDGHLLAIAGLATDSGDSGGIVRLWNVADPAHPREYAHPITSGPGENLSVVFSPNGHILAAADAHGGSGWLWSISNPAHPRVLSSFHTPGAGITPGSIEFSPDGGTLATSSPDGSIQLWDVTHPARPERFTQFPPSPRGDAVIAFGPNGKLVSIAIYNGPVQLWNVPMTILTGHTSAITALNFSPDGRLLAIGGQQDTLRLWNVTNPAHPRALGQSLAGSGGEAAAFSPNNRVLATGSYHGAVQLWDVSNPGHPRLLGHPFKFGGMIVFLAFSPDGRTLAVDSNGVQLWNVAVPSHPKPFGPMLDGTGVIYSLAFSPNGRVLATGGQGVTRGAPALQLWNVADPAHPRKLGSAVSKLNEDDIDSVAFSRDGNTLASGSYDHRIRLWDVANPAHLHELANLAIRGKAIDSVAFSPTGDTLASGSLDGKIRLWDVTNPEHIHEFMQPLPAGSYAIDSIAFNPRTGDLATGSDNTIARIWNLNVNYAINRICSEAGDLTVSQWRNYIPQLPYQPTCSG